MATRRRRRRSTARDNPTLRGSNVYLDDGERVYIDGLTRKRAAHYMGLLAASDNYGHRKPKLPRGVNKHGVSVAMAWGPKKKRKKKAAAPKRRRRSTASAAPRRRTSTTRQVRIYEGPVDTGMEYGPELPQQAGAYGPALPPRPRDETTAANETTTDFIRRMYGGDYYGLGN